MNSKQGDVSCLSCAGLSRCSCIKAADSCKARGCATPTAAVAHELDTNGRSYRPVNPPELRLLGLITQGGVRQLMSSGYENCIGQQEEEYLDVAMVIQIYLSSHQLAVGLMTNTVE